MNRGKLSSYFTPIYVLLGILVLGVAVTVVLESIVFLHAKNDVDSLSDIGQLQIKLASLQKGQDAIMSSVSQKHSVVLDGQKNVIDNMQALFSSSGVKTPAPTTSTSTSYLSNVTCCSYTQSDIPALINELLAFEQSQVANDNLFFMYISNDWADFKTTYDDVETPFATNTYLQYLVSLRTRVTNAMATNSDTMEDLMLAPFLKELNYTIELSKLDALWMQYGQSWYDIAWLQDPWQTALDMISLLSTSFTSEPDYALKVNTWLQSLNQKMTRWSAMAARSVTNRKTHADVNMRLQYDLGYGPYGYLWSFSANYTSLCVSMQGADQTTCLNNAASLMTKLNNFLTWWNNVYRPACAANRPDSAPGLWNVPDGDKIYALLQIYHTGVDQNDTYVNQLGNSGIAEILTQYDILRTQVGGSPIKSVADLITAMGDPNDARFTLCTQDPNDAFKLADINLKDIESKIVPYFGFQSRTYQQVTISGSPSTYMQAGAFNVKKKFWQTNTVFNVGVLGTCGPTGVNKPRTNGKTGAQYLAYDIVGSKSTAAHEGKPGHSIQVPLGVEIDCGFARYTSANTMFVEGWALHSEFLGIEMGFYNTPIEQLGNYQSRALRDNRLREDTCLHSSESTMPAGQSHCTYQQAVQMMMSVGFSQSYSEFEAERYIIMGGQALGYRLGDIYLQGLRKHANQTITAAGYVFDVRDFYNVILRFGGGDLVLYMTPLIETYIKYVTNQPITSADFGYDMIPSKLYSTCNPIIGLGRSPTCVL